MSEIADMQEAAAGVADRVVDAALAPLTAHRAVVRTIISDIHFAALEAFVAGPVRRAMEYMLPDVLAPEIRRVTSSPEPLGTDGAEGLEEFDDDREWLREVS